MEPIAASRSGSIWRGQAHTGLGDAAMGTCGHWWMASLPFGKLPSSPLEQTQSCQVKHTLDYILARA